MTEQARGPRGECQPNVPGWGGDEEHAREFYLPVDCPVCGRKRLIYNLATHDCRCEKCGAEKDAIYDAEPVSRLARLEEAVSEHERIARHALIEMMDEKDLKRIDTESFPNWTSVAQRRNDERLWAALTHSTPPRSK